MDALTPRRHPDNADVPLLPSLLWPAGHPRSSRTDVRLSPEIAADLDLDPLVQALSGGDDRQARFVRSVLIQPARDAAVLTYRLEVLDDLLRRRSLRQRLATLLPRLGSLVHDRQPPMQGYEWGIAQIVERLGELELYVEVAEGLAQALAGETLRSSAWQSLQQASAALVDSTAFSALRAELPKLRARFEGIKSVTIGVNLSRDLRPESATILSVDTDRIDGRGGLLGRLLGRAAAERGVTPLRGAPGASLRALFPPMAPDGHGHENALVDDLRRLLERVIAPVGDALSRYLWAQSHDFAALQPELTMFLNAAGIIDQLCACGLPMCRPEIAPPDERGCRLEASYNISLALRMLRAGDAAGASAIVTNRVSFDDRQARVWILTGPNRGGKTTYVRAAGLAQILFQAGLYVPAASARLSPVDALFTHFPGAEGTTPGQGRLDDEAERLAGIFAAATPHSLILLNEVLAGTSTLEGLALAHDAVRGLRLLGARAIYVTHLHELASHADRINETTRGASLVASLVAEVDDQGDETRHRRTFRIRPGPPGGHSYASEIAEQHGISYPQLLQLLQQRGLLQED